MKTNPELYYRRSDDISNLLNNNDWFVWLYILIVVILTICTLIDKFTEDDNAQKEPALNEDDKEI